MSESFGDVVRVAVAVEHRLQSMMRLYPAEQVNTTIHPMMLR